MSQITAMESILVVDIGNTNIVCGIYQDGKMVWFARFFSSRNRTADEYYALFASLLKEIRLEDIRHIAMASVVPELTRIWGHLFAKYFSAPVTEISALSPLGIKYKTKDPSFIGADLVANAFGAWKKYQTNCIVVDLGTATTIQLISAKGVFEGSVIAPGLKTGATQLFEKAALLSEIEIIAPTTLLGSNTRDSLLSGIVSGHAYMLETFIQKLKLLYFDHRPISTIITGGIADLLKPMLPSVDIVDKTLTLDGLQLALLHLMAE